MMHHSNDSCTILRLLFCGVVFCFEELTAEHACTRKQFNKKLSEFGLIQVIKKNETLHLCAS